MRFQTNSYESVWNKPLGFTLKTKQKVYLNMVAVNLSCALRGQKNRVCDGHHKTGDSHLHQLLRVTIALLVVGKHIDGSNRPT